VSTVFTPEEIEIITEEWSEDFVTVPDYGNPQDLPVHFRAFGFGPRPITEKYQMHLGRALFYDTRLSQDMSVSCGSCHKQSAGFADEVAFSEGAEGNLTARNSQSINNIQAYYGDHGSGFFWDARATSLEDQAMQTLANPNEMGMWLPEARSRLEAVPAYRILFQKAYPDESEPMHTSNITKALSAFTRSITSTTSRFDRALEAHIQSQNTRSIRFGAEMVRPAFDDFSAAENSGKSIYLSKCATCHSTQLPTRLSPENNGLYPTGDYADQGVGEASGDFDKVGFFKTPQLRNVALTAPYMHDGSMQTLEEVIEHYSSGIKEHVNLSQTLRQITQPVNDQTRGFLFSEDEKVQLLSFLHTLTDNDLRSKTEFSDPNL